MVSMVQQHISTTFYQWQFAATLAWWIIVKATTGKFLYDITNGSVFTCPSWLSSKILHQLQLPPRRKYVFIASLVALGLGGWGIPLVSVSWCDPQQLPIHLVAAFSVPS